MGMTYFETCFMTCSGFSLPSSGCSSIFRCNFILHPGLAVCQTINERATWQRMIMASSLWGANG